MYLFVIEPLCDSRVSLVAMKVVSRETHMQTNCLKNLLKRSLFWCNRKKEHSLLFLKHFRMRNCAATFIF